MGQSHSHNRHSTTPVPWVRKTPAATAAAAAAASEAEAAAEAEATAGPVEQRLEELEAQHWEATFADLCRAGHLRPEEFRRLYAAVFPRGDAARFADHVFRGFDEGGRGAVRFREFLAGLSVAANCRAEAKLRWALAVYGGGNRRLSCAEVADIFHAVGDLDAGPAGAADANPEFGASPPEQRARQLLRRLGRTRDDTVTVDEFVSAVAGDPDLARLLAWPQQPARQVALTANGKNTFF